MGLQSKWGRLVFLLNSTTLFWIFFLYVGVDLLLNMFLIEAYGTASSISVIRVFFNIPFSQNSTFLPLIISAYAAVLALSVAYIYPGRLVFNKPPNITFTSVSTKKFQSISEKSVHKDAVIIPLSCVNTGAIAKSLTFSLVVKRTNDKPIIPELNVPYGVFTADFSLSSMPYSKWKSELNENSERRFDEVATLDFMAPFIVPPRSSASQVCLFIPPEFITPISHSAGEDVELFLYYRDKPVSRILSEKLFKKYGGNCSKTEEQAPKGLSKRRHNAGWKMAFRIKKHIMEDIEKKYTLPGRTVTVTRFGFYRYPSKWSVPILLICEDLD